MRKADRLYALYKGDKLLATGTPREIAESTGKTFDTVMWYTFPANQRRVENSKRGHLEMVELDDKD